MKPNRDDAHNSHWIYSAGAPASWTTTASPVVSSSSTNFGESNKSNIDNVPPPIPIRQSLSTSSSAFLSGSVSVLASHRDNEVEGGNRGGGGGGVCHIPVLVAKLNQVMATTPKQVPLIFFVDPLVPCIVRLLPSTSHPHSEKNGNSNSDRSSNSRRQEQRMSEKQAFHQALQLLLHSCRRTTSGSVRFTVRLGHCRSDDGDEKSHKHHLLESPSSSLTQQKVLILECEDTGPAHEPDLDIWMDQAKPPASTTTTAGASTTNTTATENSPPLDAAASSSSSAATGPGCVLNCLPSPTTSPSALGGRGSASTRLTVGPATAAVAASSLSLAPAMALTDPCLWLGSTERTTLNAALSLSAGGEPDAGTFHNEDLHVETKVDDEGGVRTRCWFSVPVETSDRVVQELQPRQQQQEVQVEPETECDRDRAGIKKRRREEDGMSLPASDTMTSILDPKSRSNSKTALVIDDSTVVRKVLARALSQLGYETCQAVNGMEGLKQMQSSKFDLVLCDFLMPVMDGLDCVREYRKWEGYHRPGYRQYIVGMSAHASGNDVHRGLSIGMNAYRPKPVSFEDLRLLQGGALEEAVEEQNNASSSGTLTMASSPSTVAGMMHARSESRCILSLAPQVERVCLIATSDEKVAELVKAAARDQGWHAVVAKNGEEALNLMKKRNWGAVLLDSDTAELSGLSCVSRFRVWEKQNRVHRQKNVHLLTSGLTSCTRLHGYLSELQLPMGVDAGLGKPVLKEDVKQALISCEGKSVSFAARDIVTR